MNNADDRQTAIAFLRKHFIKSDVKLCSLSSYYLKHILQYSTNVYMTEPRFIGLMNELGYERNAKGKWKMRLSPQISKFIKDWERGVV